MNRLSTENLVEPINKDLEFQLQDPFLLYRKGNCEYYVDNQVPNSYNSALYPWAPTILFTSKEKTPLSDGFA